MYSGFRIGSGSDMKWNGKSKKCQIKNEMTTVWVTALLNLKKARVTGSGTGNRAKTLPNSE
jgi:hypothetical protein